jgi:hypothetical protein
LPTIGKKPSQQINKNCKTKHFQLYLQKKNSANFFQKVSLSATFYLILGEKIEPLNYAEDF